MRRRILKTITLFAAALVMTALLSACAQQTDSMSGDTTDPITIVYEGASTNVMPYDNGRGEIVDSRVHYFVLENTSDKELKSADVVAIGLDENGEELETSDGKSPSKYTVTPINPGERTYAVAFDTDWSEPPASYKLEITKTRWGAGKEANLFTVVDVAAEPESFARNVTIRNDGEEELTWVNAPDESAQSRQTQLVAIVKDDEGNVSSIDAASLMDGDDAYMQENFTLAPGEEKTISAIVEGQDQDPEFCICWIQP